MNATVRTRYGPPEVLHPTSLPTPVPAPGEIRVRVRATSVNYGDLTARNFPALRPADFNMPAPLFYGARLAFGWSTPRNPLLGSEWAGEVDAVGEGVDAYAVGDRVFGYRGQRMGAYAEHLVEKADGMVAPLPDGVSFDDAAVTAYGATTAAGLLAGVELDDGAPVLVVGASGSIGMAAMQLLAARGARITGVAGTRNLETVRELGAEVALDYTRADPGDPATEGTGPYALIFDIRGRMGFDAARRVLTPEGVYFPVSFKTPAVWAALRNRGSSGRRVRVRLAPEDPATLTAVAGHLAAGRLRTRIGASFDLDAAAEAHRAVEDRRVAGQLLIRV